MNKSAKIFCSLILFSLLVSVPSLWALWVEDGAPVCTALNNQEQPQITSDGDGGSIVTWRDIRNGNYDIYAQRIDTSGTVQWTTDGVSLCVATGSQLEPQIASDGAGGAIVTWYDLRSGNYDIYIQRINASGTVLWSTDGVALCVAGMDQSDPQITSDGAGGAIVTWYDYRNSNYDIYAQRINASGTVQWATDGVALCVATGSQLEPQITSDGAGGAIVSWYDLRSGNYDIYAQRIDASGTVQWTTDGVSLCVATGSQLEPQITSDGAGGAIVSWYDLRSGNYDIYSQRINASGAVQWTTDGISLCVATGNQLDPQITSDGASGAIVTWIDGRSGLYSIYAQRINASGTVQWTADGVPICTATGGQTDPRIIPDGAGGAIITWNDGRSSNYDIYAQVVDSKGRAGYFPPVITSIIDLPDDEGGYVRITVEKSSYDQEGWYTHPASFYNVWRRVGDPALLASIKEGKRGDAAAEIMPGSLPDRSIDPANFEGWPIIELAGRSFLESKELLPAAEFPPGTWEILGSFAACQQEEYLYIASTLTDSTASGIPLSVYMVSVHTTIPSIWFMSEPDSGYSVDNLAPAVPVGLAGAAAEGPPGIVLEWDQNTENDISHYIVYRGTHAGFIPSEPSELGETYSTDFIDEYMLWHESYYKICAVDRHGNESDFALLGPAEITGEETPDTPAAAYLSQNYPNPFNPSTTIEFGLAEASPVSLNIYDAAGRLVRVIIDETLPAAHYSEVWDGKDGSGKAVASGVYFYRLNTKTFSENRKMILLR